VLLDLGKAYLPQDRVEEAEKTFQRIVAINDSDELAGAAHFQLSQICRKLGSSAEADQQTKRFRELTRSPK
jgi:Flp pilus assembly protein TadD